MTQAFTYYGKDGGRQVRTQPTGPLPAAGEVWVRGRYADADQPSALNVRVGKSGIKVWMVIFWLTLSDGDTSRLIQEYADVLASEDVESALWFYEQNRDEIDQRIQEEMQPV